MVNKWRWKILFKKPKIGIRLLPKIDGNTLPNKIIATTLQSKTSKELVGECKIECLTIGKFYTP
jgi:hypothetical protein